MSVETFDFNQQLLTVTPAAQKHFLNSLNNSDANAVRISVQESGCTGFKYVVEEVQHAEADDITLDLEAKLTLHLSKEAVSVLQGTEIDFTREGINQTLTFRNPNVTAECGCGESFSVG